MSCSLKSTKNWLVDNNYIKKDNTVIGGLDNIRKAEDIVKKFARNKYGSLPQMIEHTDLFGVTEGNKIKAYSPFFEWVDNQNTINSKKVDLNDLRNDSIKTSIFDIKGSKKNTTVESVNINEVLFNNKNRITISEVLDNIREHYETLPQDTKDVLERIETFSKLSGAKIRFVSEDTLEDSNDDMVTVMQYDNATDTIMISKDRLKGVSLDLVTEAFLHELTHSILNKVLDNPSSMDAKMAVQQLEELLEDYKSKSTNQGLYGFTNIHEFVAEARNNAVFQQELKDIDKGGFWKRFVNAIRSLLGLGGKNNYNKVLDAILSLENESKSHKLLYNEGIFAIKKDDIKKYDLTSIEGRMQRAYDKIQRTTDLQLKQLSSSYKMNKKGSKVRSFQKHLQATKEQLNKFEKTNQYKGIIEYLKNIHYSVESIGNALDKVSENLDMDKIQISMENTRRYFALYSVIDDIMKLKHDVFKSSTTITPEDKDLINQLLKDATYNYNTISRKFNDISKEYITLKFNKLSDHAEVESKWEEKFKSQFNALYKNDKEKLKDKDFKIEWVRKKLVSHQEEVQEDLDEAIRTQVYDDRKELSSTALNMTTALEIDAHSIELTTKLYFDIRSKIHDDVEAIQEPLSKLHRKFTKGKTNNPTKLYKNLYEKSKSGIWYLKGDYKADFVAENSKLLELRETTNNLEDIYEETGDSNDLDRLTVSKKEYSDKFSELYSVDANGQKQIKSVWKNDLSKLTPLEVEVRNEFIRLLDMSHKKTYGWNTLKKVIAGVSFYKLPTMTKDNVERALDGTLIGAVKENFKGLSEMRGDDIGYATAKTNPDGDVLRTLPVHFRGVLNDPNDQSLDLFTLMAKEIKNFVSFEHKNKNLFALQTIIDVAKDSNYLQTKGLGTKIVDKDSNQQVAISHFHKNSNLVKKLEGMMETNIYDITKKYAGEIAGKDINKLIGAINGYTGFLGMTLNYHSALANAISGNAQTLIHSISKDIISRKDIIKATKLYTLHNKSNIEDTGNVFKKSFPNQILKMFDVYGGYNVGIESFLKDKKWKNLIDMGSLQFMHSMGEHQIQSVVTMAVLNSIIPMDKNGKVIKDKTLLDMLTIDKDSGLLKMDEKVVYTSHSKVTKWKEGGRTEAKLLIKHKITITQGAYDKNMATELEKTAIGSLGIMYRKFFAPLVRERYRGFKTAFKDKNKIEREDKYFSYATKEFREGFYTTAARFIFINLIPTLKSFSLKIATSDWNELSEHEKSNMYKFITETAGTFILAMLATMIAGAAEDGDDEKLYFLAYMLLRTKSELNQFININDMYRMTTTPFASMRILKSSTTLLSDIVATISPFQEGSIKKVGKTATDFIPLHNKFTTTNKQMYNFLEKMTN